MSLCNTFRLSVICCIIVLSSFDAPVAAFSARRTVTGKYHKRAVVQEDKVQLEVTTKLNVPNTTLPDYKSTERINDTTNFIPTNSTVQLELNTATEINSHDQTTTIPNESLVPEPTTIGNKQITDVAVPNTELQTSPNDPAFDTTTPSLLDKTTNIETTTNLIDVTTSSEHYINDLLGSAAESNDSKDDQVTTESEANGTESARVDIKEQKPQRPNKPRPIPKWKKYKTIERKRPYPLSEEKVKERKKTINKEDILKAESKHARVSLQDVVTSDIPSLESLKNDLLTSSIILQMSESKSGVVTLTPSASEQGTSEPIGSSSTDTITAVGHESKRAGFLNYSGKTTTESIADTTTSETVSMTTTVITDDKSYLNANYEPSPVTESADTDVLKDKSKTESQIVLNEYAVKEELLKEEAINNNEENAKRHHEEGILLTDVTEIESINLGNSAENISSSELGLKSSERSKNNTIYTVNPNYKPMKKIDVVPPKQFVRDPDDNSWRNESLSSLGIVFKPKNSSKPFTQVLKNKTETEWNNLSEKDIKNDLPDLRERLQKMAEKRKSKRKKIDSFGNVVYFDYEENSSSAEHGGVSIDERTSTVTTYSPALQSNQNTGSVTESFKNTSPLTTDFNDISYSSRTSKKPFHEYYDSTDEDDSDYLNMAQIDLKRFSSSLRTSTDPFHPVTIVASQPDWSKNQRSNSKASNKEFPERKATVQYFPPLKPQKVNFNDYDHDFKIKMESFTTPSSLPKTVSIVTPTSPDTISTVASKIDYTKNLMLSQAHLTTDPGVALINDGGFDRGTYVIRHYKDFVNEAAKQAEYDKNFGYIPYTEAPERSTKANFIRYQKEKPRTIDNSYDYNPQFQKDVLQRFVDNFNHNSDRYRSDFPILFNSSIVHGHVDHGDIASSRAFMRGNNIFKPKYTPSKKSCEPNCERMSVDLSPSYELHYYVPDQEEKEEAAPEQVTLPYRFRLH